MISSSVLYDPRPEFAVTSEQQVEIPSQKLAAVGKNIALRHLLPIQMPTVQPRQDLPTGPLQHQSSLSDLICYMLLEDRQNDSTTPHGYTATMNSGNLWPHKRSLPGQESTQRLTYAFAFINQGLTCHMLPIAGPQTQDCAPAV